MSPLSERMRPTKLDELEGQEHLVGKGSILRTAIENSNIPSMIFWGPPGSGKTTIANIIAHTLNVPFYQLSAISSGVKEVREGDRKGEATVGRDLIHRRNSSVQ
jgi:putative ATPase